MAKKSSGTEYAPARSDAYTGMLVISLFALAGGAALLYLDYNSYQEKSPPAVPNIVPKPVAPAPAPQPGGPAPQPQPGAPMPQPGGAQP